MVRHPRALHRRSSRRLRLAPYPIPSYDWKVSEKEVDSKKTSVTSEKRDWEDVTCSVCMEYPHNAVLLLCSSHDKGCRPYMCGTSYRHSNCLDQFKNAYTKMATNHDQGVENAALRSHNSHLIPLPFEKSKKMELACPLCRGQVKGWTVVNPAREYLNQKKRSCAQEDCSFVGTYKELSRHVRSEHPSSNPHEVDPVLEQKWRMLEHERERQDVISTIRSSMPRSVVVGDYVIETGNSETNTDDEAGDRHGDLDLENRGISGSILYLFLRESARLMSLYQDNEEIEAIGDPPNSEDADVVILDEDNYVTPVVTQTNRTDAQRAERRHRRRRRSHGRSVSG
ncbi:hypothetical protein ZIOFF_071209 [Zingiber officinale]|uniref:Uncharacterized protein n=2 Tax=Zingiber officinale TaxID=94328 RepID=A0A8J5C9E0_ZINOF|nr:hypothetical protein ZIOFF_071209 [Zingiber officinale]